MGIIQTLKKTFLPTEKVAAERRLNTFGTENKAVAGTVIAAGAGAAIAAGPVVIAGAAAKVGTKVKESFVAAKLGTQAAIIGGTVLGGAFIAGSKEVSVTDVPRVAVKISSKTVDYVHNTLAPAYDQAMTGNYTKAGQTFAEGTKENPIGAATVGAIGTAIIGPTAYYGIKTVKELTSSYDNAPPDLIKQVEEEYQDTIKNIKVLETDKSIPQEKDLPKTKDVIPSNVPLTPATQIVGKSVTSQPRKTLSRTKKPLSNVTQSLRVNIYNQSKITKKYLNVKAY